jgi:FixJ family two-component response regulator
VRAIKAGAEDFLTKPATAQTLLDSIERAVARHQSQRTQLQWQKEARERLDTLTPREREVFEFIVRGKMNKQAAFALGITERTIKAHRQRVISKLGAHSIADLVSFAERAGVLKEL